MAWAVLVVLLCFSICTLATRPDFTHLQTQNSGLHGFHHAKCDENGVYNHQFNHNSHRSSSMFSYTAKRAENVFVLDDDMSVHHVVCFEGGLSLHVMDKKLVWGVGALLVGGVEWGCKQADGQPHIFIRRVTSISVTSHPVNGFVVETSTSDASYSDLFSFVNASLQSKAKHEDNHSTHPHEHERHRNNHVDHNDDEWSKKQREAYFAALQDRRIAQAGGLHRSIEADDTLTVLTPGDSDVYSTTDSKVIPVEIGYSGFSAGTEIRVRVKKRGATGLQMFASDITDEISIQSNDQGKSSLEIPIGNWESSDNYYIAAYRRSGFACVNTGIGCLSDNSEEFTIEGNPPMAVVSPRPTDVFYPNDVIKVEYTLPPKVQPTDKLQVELMRKTGPAIYKSVFKFPESTWEKLTQTVTVPASPTGDWVDSSQYYFKLSWGCKLGGLICSKGHSEHFTVVIQSSSSNNVLQINKPTFGTNLKTSDSVNLEWSWDSQNTINSISLKMDTWWAPTVKVDRDVANSGSKSHTVESSWRSNPAYYFLIEYDCRGKIIGDWYLFCKRAESPRFSVNYNPPIIISAPVAGEVFSGNADREINVKWTSTLDPNTKVNVALKQLRPVIWPKTYENSGTPQSAEGILVSANSWKATVSESGSLFPLFFEISFNCLVGGKYFCSTVESGVFASPAHWSASWNYNKDTQKSDKSITFFRQTCDSCPKENPPKPFSIKSLITSSPLCKLCGVGGSGIVDVSCTDCYANSMLDIMNFRFGIGSSGISELNLEASGKSDVSVIVSVDMNAALELGIEPRSVLPQPISLLGFSFRIAGIPFQIGVALDVLADYQTSFKLLQHGVLNFGASIGASYGAKIVSKPTFGVEANAKLTKLTPVLPNVGFSVISNSKFGVSLALIASVANLATLKTTLHPSLLVNATFTYPPFDPVIPNNNNNDIDQQFLLKKTGNCTVKHFFEYNVSTVADLSVGAELTLPQVISKKWNYVPWELSEKLLATGCHFNAGNFVSNFERIGNSLIKESDKLLNNINKNFGGKLKVLAMDVNSTANQSGFLFVTILYEAGGQKRFAQQDTSSIQTALSDSFGVPPEKISVTTDPSKPGVAQAKVETGPPASDAGSGSSSSPDGKVSASGDAASFIDKIAGLAWYYTLSIGAGLMAVLCLIVIGIVVMVKTLKKPPEEERV